MILLNTIKMTCSVKCSVYRREHIIIYVIIFSSARAEIRFAESEAVLQMDLAA